MGSVPGGKGCPGRAQRSRLQERVLKGCWRMRSRVTFLFYALLMSSLVASASSAAALEGGIALDIKPELGKGVSVGVSQLGTHSPASAIHQEVATSTSIAIRNFFAWLFQLIASCAWVVSVFIYGSYETGDVFQLTAALSWTLSNALAMPEAVMPLIGRREQRRE